jgi:tetratricopeptide (TPR) repeat protein
MLSIIGVNVLDSCRSSPMEVWHREKVRLAACALAKPFPTVVAIVVSSFLSSWPAFPSIALPMLVAQESIEERAIRAEQFEHEGKWDDAESAYREILKIDPQSIAALNRLGAIEVQRGRFEAGIQYYKQALAFNPSEFATNLNLGIAYIKRKDYETAVPPLERAAQAAPENFQVQELLGGALVGRNDFSRAVTRLEKASELNPNDLATLYLLERSYLATKQFEKALRTFERLESLDPGSPWVRILRGQAEDGLGNYQNAVEDFEVARRQLPRDATVRFSLGFMYWKLHRFAEAEAEIKEAVKLDTEFEEAKYYLADTYIMEEKPAAALPVLAALIRAQPRNARALADEGKALEKLNRDAEAARAYKTCLRIEPERADAHYQLARVYRKQKRSNEYLRELTIAKRLQQQKRDEQETLLHASGTHADPFQQGETQIRLPAADDHGQH